MKQELTIVQKPEYKELIEKSGIELTKAEAHVMAFGENFNSLAELSRPLADLKKLEPTKEVALQAREHRLKLVKVRTAAKTIKDDRKKVILIEGNLIQSVYNMLENSCSLTEAEYEEIEKHEQRIEAQRKADLSASGIAKLEPFGVDTTYLPLGVMTDESFDKLLEDSELVFTARKEREEKAEKERIEAERLAAELAEKQRIEREVEEKRIRDENEKLKKEAEEKEAILKIEREKADKEKAKLDAKLKAEREESERNAKIQQDEINRVNAELQAKKDAEDLALKLEKERIEAEESEKIAKEKAALMAPDKEKVRAFYDKFIALEFPELKSDAGKVMSVRIIEALAMVKKLIIEDSKTLL